MKDAKQPSPAAGRLAYQDGADFYDVETDELIESYPDMLNSDHDVNGAIRACGRFALEHLNYRGEAGRVPSPIRTYGLAHELAAQAPLRNEPGTDVGNFAFFDPCGATDIIGASTKGPWSPETVEIASTAEQVLADPAAASWLKDAVQVVDAGQLWCDVDGHARICGVVPAAGVAYAVMLRTRGSGGRKRRPFLFPVESLLSGDDGWMFVPE